MPMSRSGIWRSTALSALLAAAAASSFASCDRDEARFTAAAVPPAPPPPPPLPLGASPATDEPGPDGGASGDAIVATGEWTENKLYKFRLGRVAACGAAAATLGPAQPAAASAVGTLRGETSWVGAFFDVQAKQPALFVSPRDLELRRGGVILNARHINQPLLPGCKPLLPAKLLGPGERAGGFVLFEVPKSFRVTTDDPIVLSYRPTRWGGARRVEVPIRECLDACPGPLAGNAAPHRTR